MTMLDMSDNHPACRISKNCRLFGIALSLQRYDELSPITGMPLQYGLSMTGRCGAQSSSQSDREVTATPRIVCIVARHLASR